MRKPATSLPDRAAENKMLLKIIGEPRPWDAARKLKVVRHDYQLNEALDPGVNFFVMALCGLGARPLFSCEGHPRGFYIWFMGSYELAQAIERAGFFEVKISRGKNSWRLNLVETVKMTEARRCRVLRWAAEAWVEKLIFPFLASEGRLR